MRRLNIHGWEQLWNKLQASEAPNDVLKKLIQAYSSPDRFYHTLIHIQDCLTQFDQTKPLAVNPEAVELAIWFHDAVYDSKRNDNEQRSAQWASSIILHLGLSSGLAQTVSQLILATRHDSSISDPDSRLLVDIDLSILGREESVFEQYNANIRKEYAWVPDDLFRQKRAEVLRGFLAREYIYWIEPFRKRFESQARVNLHRAIAQLNS